MPIDFQTRQYNKLRPDLEALELMGPLPFINGTWFFVDPENGSNSETGQSVAKAVADIQTAYGLCTTGDGDGIVLISSGTSSANTTSYLDTPLTWSKHGITVIGRCAPTRMGQRSRISNVNRTTGSISTLAFPTATTMTDSASGFVTAGFEVGNLIEIVTNDGTNDGQAIITAVAAGTITCSAETFTVQLAAVTGASTIDTYMTHLIEVSGDNNVFVNVHMANYDSDDLSIGALIVSGLRNAFVNCHIYGAGNATPAATTGAFDLKIDGGEENSFYSCTFGSDTIIRAAANGNISFDGGALRSYFEDCSIISYSATAGKGAIISVDAGSIQGIHQFTRCKFLNWNENGIADSDSAFIGTAPTSGAILIDACILVGWAAWDSVGGNDMVYVGNCAAVATGAGGIATVV